MTSAADSASHPQPCTPLLPRPPQEEILHSQEGVRVFFGEGAGALDLGEGSLYVTSKSVHWLSDSPVQPGYAFGFQDLSIHGICAPEEDVVCASHFFLAHTLKMKIHTCTYMQTHTHMNIHECIHTQHTQDENAYMYLYAASHTHVHP